MSRFGRKVRIGRRIRKDWRPGSTGSEIAYLALVAGSYQLSTEAPGDAFFVKHVDGLWRLNDDPTDAATIVKQGTHYVILG